MSLEGEVLAAIKPTEEERAEVLQAAENLMERLAQEAASRGIPAEPVLVGSVAKDTFLKNPEIDVFVAFPPDTPRGDLERWGLELGEVLEKPQRRYAEHPYTRGLFMGYRADVVPCYKLHKPTEKMTAVDRTPFHLEYVKERLTDEQKDQVRLLKRFMKGILVYGAEAKVQGFSGYLCELLILKFGTFKGVLRAARRWRPPVRLKLDMEARRKFEEPMIFVDPVDGERNAASAVSLETLARFIYAAREYLRDPSRSYFFPPDPRRMTPAEIRQEMESRGTSFLAIVSGAPDLPEDVLYPQLRKAEQAVVALLRAHDFRVFRSEATLEDGKWILLLEMEVGQLPGVKKHLGPPPWMQNADSFTDKWRSSSERVVGPYVEEARLVVEIQRGEVDSGDVLERGLPTLSLGKHLDEAVRKHYSVLRGMDIVEAGYGDVLSAFLRRDPPWTAAR